MPQNTLETGRDRKGKFISGISGNPGGRPKISADVKEFLKEKSHKALEIIVDILEDEKADRKERIRCAEIILDRHFGRPKQSVDLDMPKFKEPERLSLGEIEALEAELIEDNK